VENLMAKTLAQIETLTRFFARDETLSLTNTTGLIISNTLYRSLAASFKWTEFRQVHDLTTATTSGTGVYTWAFSGTPVFRDVTAVEVGSDASDTTFVLLIPAPSETVWAEVRNDANSIPAYYQRLNSAGTDQIELRPIPAYTSATIKVTGIIQPAEFTAGSSTTEFLQSTVDDALAHIIAASFSFRDGFEQLGAANIQAATSMLQSVLKGESVTTEIVRNIAGNA
jgi:hypothetical protein